jgi:hypothetical protein
MVEYSVSRFKKAERVAETDEPLTILGLVTFLEKHHHTLEGYLRDALNASKSSVRAFAFESFSTYILARHFSTPTRLSDVFGFVGKSELQQRRAELVTLEKTDDGFRITPFNLASAFRSSHVFGCSTSTPAETLEWLLNPRGSTFCFPANAVGPDLIFVLRLTDDSTRLRVCVQFKNRKEMGRKETGKAIRTTEPYNFLSQLKDEGPTISNPLMQAKMVDAIKLLGKGTDTAGVCGVLRVVISYPSPPNDDTLDNDAEGDYGHPLATVAFGLLEPTDSNLGQSILGLANRTLQMPDQKRRGSNETDGRTRRRKTGTN